MDWIAETDANTTLFRRSVFQPLRHLAVIFDLTRVEVVRYQYWDNMIVKRVRV